MINPFFKFYVQDFAFGTRDMTEEEVGIYVNLLCEQWDKGAIYHRITNVVPRSETKTDSGITSSKITSKVMMKFQRFDELLLSITDGNHELSEEIAQYISKNKIKNFAEFKNFIANKRMLEEAIKMLKYKKKQSENVKSRWDKQKKNKTKSHKKKNTHTVDEIDNEYGGITNVIPVNDNDSDSDNDNDNKRLKGEKSKNRKMIEMVEYYHQLNPDLSKVVSLSDRRKSRFSQRLKEFGVEKFKLAIEKISQSNFLQGGGEKGFKANFDFLIQESSFIKIIEGFYDNRETKLMVTHKRPDGRILHSMENKNRPKIANENGRE